MVVTSILELQPVGGEVVECSSLVDPQLILTNGAQVVQIPASNGSGNGTHGTNRHGAGPIWDTLLQLMQAEKVRKGSSRTRKKEPGDGASHTEATNLWVVLNAGGEACKTALNKSKAEDLMPDTTSVSQASLW